MFSGSAKDQRPIFGLTYSPLFYPCKQEAHWKTCWSGPLAASSWGYVHECKFEQLDRDRGDPRNWSLVFQIAVDILGLGEWAARGKAVCCA